MAATLDLPEIEKGATYEHTIYWKDKLKQPINLTGVTARMQIRESVESSVVILELSTTNGKLIITPLLGKIDFLIDSTTTSNLIGSEGVYDLELTLVNGKIKRLIEGGIVFSPEVTR